MLNLIDQVLARSAIQQVAREQFSQEQVMEDTPVVPRYRRLLAALFRKPRTPQPLVADAQPAQTLQPRLER